MGKKLTTAEKIEALANDMVNWDHDSLLVWAKESMRDALKESDPLLVDRQYIEAIGDEPMDDTDALDEIRELLSGQEWGSETLDEVARLVRETGREILEPNYQEGPGEPLPEKEELVEEVMDLSSPCRRCECTTCSPRAP